MQRINKKINTTIHAVGAKPSRPLFLLCTIRGGWISTWVFLAVESERSAVEAAAVVSDWICRTVTERVIILTVSAK